MSDGGGYRIVETTDGEFSISMGFSANIVIYGDKLILFGDLRPDTWIPGKGTRKETNYASMDVVLEDGEIISEKVSCDSGYIIILKDDDKVKDMIFYKL